ncbi:hypothetical protein ECPA25_3339, partial [Escherichia coli PA25]
MRFSG